MPATPAKELLSIVICGRFAISESTTSARLKYDLGGFLKYEEAVRLVPGPIAFTFHMDSQKEEHECGATSACPTQDFYTEKKHDTVVIDASGHRVFNKDDHLQKKSDNLGRWKGCDATYDKDCDTHSHKQFRYAEIAEVMKIMLVKVGRNKDFDEKATPTIPVSSWMADYLPKKSDNINLWKECVDENGKVVEDMKDFFKSQSKDLYKTKAEFMKELWKVFEVKNINWGKVCVVEYGKVIADMKNFFKSQSKDLYTIKAGVMTEVW